MRRPVAIVCVAALLVPLLVLALAAPATASAGILREPVGLTVPTAPVHAPAPASAGALLPLRLELVSLLLFRGPPANGSSLEKHSDNPTREDARCSGRPTWRRS